MKSADEIHDIVHCGWCRGYGIKLQAMRGPWSVCPHCFGAGVLVNHEFNKWQFPVYVDEREY